MTGDRRHPAPGWTRAAGPERLSEHECLELLGTTTVGRVAFVDDDGVQLLPLNFAAVDGEIYFRTDARGILGALAVGNDDVAFEIDYHGEVSRYGWNVTVKGRTERVSDEALRATVLGTPRLDPWARGDRTEVVHLSRRTIAGRRVSD